MLVNPLIVAIAFFCAAIFAQVPEFMQQYRQRIGGAVDELSRIVQHFDEDSRRSGYDRPGAIGLMENNPERLIRDQAIRMEETIVRLDNLLEQQKAFKDGVSLSEFMAKYDRPLVDATYEAYAFAIPMTKDGWLYAALGFVIPYFLMLGVASGYRRQSVGA